MSAAYRQYSDADKAAALVALDLHSGNVARTAKALQIPRSTLRCWAGGHSETVAEIRHHKKRELADLLESLAFDLVDISQESIDQASAFDRVKGFAIAVDKMLLLRGCICGAAR